MKKYLLLIFFLNLSCENSKEENEKKIEGSWQIDSIYYNGSNFKNSLYYNLLFFQKNIVKIPKTSNYDYLDSNYHFEIVSKKKKITINSKNHFFNGVYEVSFFKNKEKKLLGMKLKSKSMTIISYKFLEDFDYDGIDW